MEYKVRYTIYSNMEWQHWDKETIIKADSKEDAKKMIEDNSDYGYEFSVRSVEEVK